MSVGAGRSGKREEGDVPRMEDPFRSLKRTGRVCGPENSWE